VNVCPAHPLSAAQPQPNDRGELKALIASSALCRAALKGGEMWVGSGDDQFQGKSLERDAIADNTEHQTCNEGLYLTLIIRLRLKTWQRVEVLRLLLLLVQDAWASRSWRGSTARC